MTPKPSLDTPSTVETGKRIAREEEHDDSLDRSSLDVGSRKMVRTSPAEVESVNSSIRVVDVEEALRSDYYFKPTLEELRERFVNESVKIDEAGLIIGRLGYGSVLWRGPFEIHNIEALKDVVNLRAKEVVVYPDQSKKPHEGMELNRPAEVTLERVWPISKQTGMSITDPDEIHKQNFREKLERMSKIFGGTFVDYNPVSGIWTFKVPSF